MINPLPASTPEDAKWQVTAQHILVQVESVERFSARARRLARAADAGQPMQSHRILSFPTLDELLATLTPSRCRLLAAVLGVPKSLSDLETFLHRGRRTLKRDVDALLALGLLIERTGALPGQRARRLVQAAAPTIEIRATLGSTP